MLILYLQSECETVGIQIRPEVLSGLMLVQTVCKAVTLLGKQLTACSSREFPQRGFNYDNVFIVVVFLLMRGGRIQMPL